MGANAGRKDQRRGMDQDVTNSPVRPKSGQESVPSEFRLPSFVCIYWRAFAVKVHEWFFAESWFAVRRGVPVFVSLAFFGAFFWAHSVDPFRRKWFNLKAQITNHKSIEAVSVLPTWRLEKPRMKPKLGLSPDERDFGREKISNHRSQIANEMPVVIYLHGPEGSLMTSGRPLRQFAELGMATLCMEYDKTNAEAFDQEFSALLAHMTRQKWANTNAVAWVGVDLGAERMVEFARRHPELRPEILIRLSAQEVTEWKADFSQRNHKNGWKENLKLKTSVPFSDDGAVIYRLIAEYCKSALTPEEPFAGVPERKTVPFLVWMIPAFAWATFCLHRWRRKLHLARECEPYQPLKTWEKALRVVAVVMGAWAATEIGVHLLTPRFAAGDRTMEIARRRLVAPRSITDFDWLSENSAWQGKPLKWLLDSVELSHYNRNELINWKVEDTIYRDYVMSPDIGRVKDDEPNWRRPLWESFYPRVRHENTPETVAAIVIRFLRERVTITKNFKPKGGITTAWERGITDEAGFERIYVAALRSVGVGSRLNTAGKVEFWTGDHWATAPRPIAASFLF